QVLTELAAVQRLAGDYRSATASSQQAIELCRNLRDRRQRAYALNELGLVQQLTGDYPAAAASHQQALRLNRDVGNRLGQAETLNCLGELPCRTADGHQAPHHTRAPSDEARHVEATVHTHLRHRRPREATTSLEQALALYQHIAAPAARRVQETLHQLRQDSPARAPER